MTPYFGYELSSVPAALFKDNFTRKPNKSQLKKVLLKGINTAHAVLPHTVCVIYGGVFLHKVKWQPDVTMDTLHSCTSTT